MDVLQKIWFISEHYIASFDNIRLLMKGGGLGNWIKGIFEINSLRKKDIL